MLGSNWSRCWDKQRAKTLVTQLLWTFGIYGIQSEDGKTQILESRLSLTEKGCKGSEAQVWETWPRNWQDELGGHYAVEWGFQDPVCCCVVWLCAVMVEALKHFPIRFSCVCNMRLSFINSFDLLNCWDLGSLLYVFICSLFLSFTIFLIILGKILSLASWIVFLFHYFRVCVLYLNRSLSQRLLKAALINPVALKSSDNVLLNVTLRLKSSQQAFQNHYQSEYFSVQGW